MLSDAIRDRRRTFAEFDHSGVTLDGGAVRSLVELLAVWEAEARNMETRLAGVAGRPHAPFAEAALRGPNVILFPLPERPFSDGGRP